MRIVARQPRPRRARDDGARRHAERPRDLPRRVHLHAGRQRVRLRLQQLQSEHGRFRVRHRFPGAGARRRCADRQRARAQRGRPHGRLRHRGHEPARRERRAVSRQELPDQGARHRRGGPRRDGTKTRCGRPRADRDREPRRAGGVAAAAAPMVAQARVRQRPALPEGVRSRRRRARRLSLARRSRAAFRSPSRRTCATITRSACSPSRARRSCASTRRRARRGSRRS